MYEVQNRSREEHDHFSIKIERKNLSWLYKANLDFVREMTRINHLDNLVAHGKLQGSIFKANRFGARTQRGVTALAASIFGYVNFAQMSLLLGPNILAFGLVASAYYGTSMLRDTDVISQIDYVSEGENSGKIRVKIQKSLVSSYWILANPSEMRSLATMEKNDIFNDATDS